MREFIFIYPNKEGYKLDHPDNGLKRHIASLAQDRTLASKLGHHQLFLTGGDLGGEVGHEEGGVSKYMFITCEPYLVASIPGK